MRMHERSIPALVRGEDPVELASPAPGLFRRALAIGDVVHAGSVLGELETLGQLVRVVAPDAARGAVIATCDPASTRPAVEYGAMLVTLDPHASAAPVEAQAPASLATGGLAFRAPTSGRFYGRSAPDKPPFVSAGDELAEGATVCLLEVMKTFHRVHYSGDPARVREVLVRDGDDVNAGDALLALEPI